MARMLPDVSPNSLPHSSERGVYQALRDQLPDDYLVLHSYPWLRPERDRQGYHLRQGEADFVVLHPVQGLLVLEVKGGELELRERQWYRRRSSDSISIKDPFEQAKQSRHTLMEILARESHGQLSEQTINHGFAVVFPHHNYQGNLPANADKAVIIGERDMADLPDAIARAYRAWIGTRPRPMDRAAFQRLQSILMPHFALVRALGAELDLSQETLLELTTEQHAAFQGLYDNHRVLVEGSAGSGKTVLALERALAYAREGKRCLFVCFNRELATYLDEKVAADPLHADYADRLLIRNFHRLADEYAKRAGVEVKWPLEGQSDPQFWNEEVPGILEQAVEILRINEDCTFDAIVVDEAQDFCEMWWYSLTHSFLNDPEQGPLYIFRDPNQALFRQDEPLPFDIPFRYKLLHNCRNTRRIAHCAAGLIQVENQTLSRTPEGQSVRVLVIADSSEQRRVIRQEVQRLLVQERLPPSRVALLGARAWKNPRSPLASDTEIAGIQLTGEAMDWRQGRGVLVTTARAFKGLEADVVVLHDVGELNRYFTPFDLYVACTRARFLLIVVTHDAATAKLLSRVSEPD